MMKKVLLTAFAGFLAYSAAIGQACTPNPNYTPSSPTGGIEPLPCAVIDQPYNEAATIVVPTVYTYSGFQVNICKVRVDSVTNFPPTQGAPNYTIYYGGSSVGQGQFITLNTSNPTDRACVRVNNTFTSAYQDSLRAWASVQLYATAQNCSGSPLATIPVSTLNDGQGIGISFTVAQTCTNGIEETISNNSFDVAQNFPNPFFGESQIAFNLPEAGKVDFRVTNLVGKIVKDVTIYGNAGLNYMNISSADYAAGVYMYSVSFGGKTITKRMIVK